MDRHRLLLTGALVATLVLLAPSAVWAADTGWGGAEDGTTTSGTNTGSSVDIHGTTPGSPGAGGGSDADGTFITIGDGGETGGSQCIRIVADRCYTSLYRPEDAAPGTPTLSDIASFRPQVGTAHMQPNGWGVVGLHTNFYATGDAHVVTGTLLGQPASVRFTPVGWHWTYGDGSSASVGSPGGTWAQLGIREFDATPGSHVYTAKAAYTVTLTIEYAAEYQFAGQPWLPIAGTLMLPSNDLGITTWRVKTVLVAEDCLANPSAPGCPGG